MDVLIIDDDLAYGDALSQYFALRQIDTHQITHAKQFDQLELSRFDFVLLDFNLRSWDGTEAIDLLEQHGFQGHIVIITGMSDNVLRFCSNHAMLRGLSCIGAFKKPFKASALLNVLLKQKELDERSGLNQSKISKQQIQSALTKGQFDIAYHPQYQLENKYCFGFEVLSRWRTPQLGNISPGDFIPKIDTYGLHNEFNAAVFSKALAQFCEIELTDRKLAFNLSVNHLKDPFITRHILNEMSKYNLPYENLTIEVTEDKVLTGQTQAQRALLRLREQGIRISMDDFGTGFSSLQQLTSFNFDEIKVDQFFTQNCTQDSKSRAILQSSITLGKEFGVDLVVEGIEDREQEKFVMGLGAKLGQGFLYSKPLAFDQLSNLARTA